MSSSHLFAIMSLQSLEENYHKVCHNYLLYSAISAIVSGKGTISVVCRGPVLIYEWYQHDKCDFHVYRLVGSITLVLQQIIQDGELSISENLVDANNRLIEVS